MEKIIELQITELQKQRGALINQITRLEEMSINYTVANMEIRQSVDRIDQEINNALLMAERVLTVTEGKPVK